MIDQKKNSVSNSDSYKKIIGQLLSSLLKNLSILTHEAKTTLINWRYFATYEDKQNGSNASMRFAFGDLSQLSQIILNELNDNIDRFGKILDGYDRIFFDRESDISVWSDEEEKKLLDLFSSIFYWKREIVTTVKYLGFLQRKMNYLNDAYPSYFPSFSFYRTKQELKSYQFLKNIFKEFFCLLLKDYSRKIDNEENKNNCNFNTDNIVVNWAATDDQIFEFGPQNIPFEIIQTSDKNKVILFYGSYFLLNRQSQWVILLHEVMHALLLMKTERGENHEEDDKKGWNLWREYADLKFRLKPIIIKMHHERSLAINDVGIINNVLDDIFCDSFLTMICDSYYPILFADMFLESVDESHYSIYDPINNIFWLRLFVASEFFNWEREKDNQKITSWDYKNILLRYNHLIRKHAKNKYIINHAASDEILGVTLIEAMKSFFDMIPSENKMKISELIGDFKEEFDSSDTNKTLRAYLAAHKKIAQKFLDETSQEGTLNVFPKAGRIVTSALCRVLDYSKGVNESDIVEFGKCKIILMDLIKLRFSGASESKGDGLRFHDILNELEGFYSGTNNGKRESGKKTHLFANIGPYQAIMFKVLDEEETEAEREIKELVSEIESIKKDFDEDHEAHNDSEKNNKIPLHFKYEIVGHVIDFTDSNGEKQENYNEFFELSEMIITVQLALNRQSPEFKEKITSNQSSETFSIEQKILKHIKGKIIAEAEKENTRITENGEIYFLTIQTAGWQDFVVLIGYRFNPETDQRYSKAIKGLIDATKRYLHVSTLIAKSFTNISFRPDKGRNRIGGEYFIRTPSVNLRYSSTNKNNSKIESLLSKLKIDSFSRYWRAKLYTGIYDIALIPKDGKDLTGSGENLIEVYKMYDRINDILDSKDTSYLSDIQMRYLICDNVLEQENRET